jgi:hypothetical protein
VQPHSGVFTALAAGGRFFIGFALVGSEREELLALRTGTDFEIRRSIGIDICGKKQFVWVVPDGDPIRKLHYGEAIVEDFKCGFLPFAVEDMTYDENRLPFPLGAKIAQAMLGRGCAGKLAAGTCSY